MKIKKKVKNISKKIDTKNIKNGGVILGGLVISYAIGKINGGKKGIGIGENNILNNPSKLGRGLRKYRK